MQKDFEETRAFYLVVEKEEKLWLRKVVMSVDKLVGEEELKAEDLYSFEKPEEAGRAGLVGGREAVPEVREADRDCEGRRGRVALGPEVEKQPGLRSHSTHGGLRCLGELEGVTQDVNILQRQATPDPTATGIGLLGRESVCSQSLSCCS